MINPVLLYYHAVFPPDCTIAESRIVIRDGSQRNLAFFFLQGCRLNTGIAFKKPSQGSKLRPIQLPMQSNPSVAIFLAIKPDIALPNFSSSSLVLSLIFTMDLYLFFAHFPNSGLYSLLSLNMQPD